MAAISRPISIFDGAFSSRDMVGCEHRGSPLSGAWPTAQSSSASRLTAGAAGFWVVESQIWVEGGLAGEVHRQRSPEEN
jgi:hypothetical protein